MVLHLDQDPSMLTQEKTQEQLDREASLAINWAKFWDGDHHWYIFVRCLININQQNAKNDVVDTSWLIG